MYKSGDIALSKEISYALRHAPGEYGLVLDEEGFVDVGDLVKALSSRVPRKQSVTTEDIERAISCGEKKRHEIIDGRIRALYGHSVGTPISMSPEDPPEGLYHGTSRRALSSILSNGIQRMSRQMVHLSTDYETAMKTALRHDDRPVVLQVAAARAHGDGIQFFRRNETVWLCSYVAPEYISLFEP